MYNKEYLSKCLNLFGHLLPEDKKTDSYTFCKLINTNFSLNNPITYKMYSYISKSVDLYYTRSNGRIKIVKI